MFSVLKGKQIRQIQSIPVHLLCRRGRQQKGILRETAEAPESKFWSNQHFRGLSKKSALLTWLWSWPMFKIFIAAVMTAGMGRQVVGKRKSYLEQMCLN